MNNNIVDRAIENSKIREKLHGAGIFPTLIVGPTGPTGPQGNGLVIEGSFDTEEDLKKAHPVGKVGECFQLVVFYMFGMLMIINGKCWQC